MNTIQINRLKKFLNLYAEQNPNTINKPKVNGRISIDYPLARDLPSVS